MAKAKKKAKRKTAAAKRKTPAKRETAAKRKATAKRKSSRGRKSASKRSLISPRGNKRFVRRTRGGQFDEVDDVGRSLSNDRRRKAKRRAKSGQGDRGDR